ncbi:MAG: restriction endonuclease subunit S [Deltaproteobacteria bacterium]|nr:restriction endonuclease subunit S [Deltaproteobacteria bacterium]
MTAREPDRDDDVLSAEDGELPEGWAECLMGDIAEVVGGGTPSAYDETNFCDNGHAWITPADLSRFEGVYIKRGRRGLSDKGLKSSSARLMPARTVLMSSRAPIGYVAIAANEICTNQGFKSFICREDISPEYVFYWLKHKRLDIEEMGSGSTFTEISGSRCKEIPFIFPTLAEQKRIVARVESLLASVNAARERLDKAPSLLARFRQSVLASACSGRLTEDWREKIRDAEGSEELVHRLRAKRRGKYEQYIAGRYKEPCSPSEDKEYEYPEQWSVTSIDELTCLVTSGSRGWAQYYSDIGPVFIRAQNINTDELCLDDIAHVKPPDSAEGLRTRVQKDDMLITITGANVTKAAIVNIDLEEAYVSQHVALARPVDPAIATFLYLWIISPAHGRKKLTSDAYGAGKPGLNLENIREMFIPLPPLPEQQEIVRRVEALFAFAKEIERRVETARAKANALTQSILRAAFRGELVETEADLARREGREYEPASVLLERIRAEKSEGSHTAQHRRSSKSSVSRQNAVGATGRSPLPPPIGHEPTNAVNGSRDGSDHKPASTPSRAAKIDIDDTERDDIMGCIREAFSTGGPRDRETAIRDIARAAGYTRVGDRVREVLDTDVLTAVRRGILNNERGQLSLLCRAIDEYEKDHLVDMLLATTGNSWSEQDDLIRATARHLGFRRTGAQIQDTIKNTIRTAILRGLIEREGTRLRKAR